MINFSKLSRLCYQLFYGLFGISLLWILLVNIRVDLKTQPIVFLIFLLYILAIFFLRKLIKKNHKLIIPSNRKNYLEIILWILLFVGISLIGLTLRVTPTWDYGMVHRYAFEWVKEGKIEDLSYFARYPNNNLMLLITASIYKLLDFLFPSGLEINYIKATIIVNSFLVTLSIYLTSLSAKQMYGDKFKKISIFFLIFLTPIIFYTEIFYTDIIGLFFISLLSFILARKINDFNLIDGILIGIIVAFGFKIKAFILIILIALVIVLLLKKNLRLKKKLLLIVATCFSFVTVNTLLTITMDKMIGLDEAMYDQYQFPTSHWIMMSLNPKADGGFVQSDYEETRATDGRKNKDELIEKKLSNRLNQLGKEGLVQHLFYKKIKRTWTVGSMAVDDYAQRENVYQTILHEFMTKDGNYHLIYYILSQGTHLLMIVLMLGGAIISLINSKDELNVLNITIFGLILFLIIWECNSRYLFSFIPFFVLTSLPMLNSELKLKK